MVGNAPLTACRRHCIRGHQASEEVKPVVARLVVFGAAVGSLALLAGAVTLIVRPGQPTDHAVDPLRLAQATDSADIAPAVPAPSPPAAVGAGRRALRHRSCRPPLRAGARAAEPGSAGARARDGSAAVDWLLKGRR